MKLFTIDTTTAWETCPGSGERPTSVTRYRKKDGKPAAGTCPHCKPDNSASAVRLNYAGNLMRHYRPELLNSAE